MIRLTLALALLLPLPAAAQITGRAIVIDADTLTVAGQTYRLDASDAPETRQTCRRDGVAWACGRAATAAVVALIAGDPVTCAPTTRRLSYGRHIGRCMVRWTDIGAWTVRQGWALAYVRYSRLYVPLEAEARAARRGIWAGTFDPPWEWRQKHRRQ